MKNTLGKLLKETQQVVKIWSKASNFDMSDKL